MQCSAFFKLINYITHDLYFIIPFSLIFLLVLRSNFTLGIFK